MRCRSLLHALLLTCALVESVQAALQATASDRDPLVEDADVVVENLDVQTEVKQEVPVQPTATTTTTTAETVAPVAEATITNESETPSVAAETSQPTLQVQDHLDTLSEAELRQICHQRGLDTTEDEYGNWTHADFVQAARRCISFEKEMQAILADHPELAAELESEIVRMQQAKERLEAERASLIMEKELLERQLRDAGVVVEYDDSAWSLDGDTAISLREALQGLKKRNPTTMTSLQVFTLSLVLLFERVGQDMIFIWKYAVGPLARPAGKIVQQSYASQVKSLVERTKLRQHVAAALYPLRPFLLLVRFKTQQVKSRFVRALVMKPPPSWPQLAA
jgi:hypothetical protein